MISKEHIVSVTKIYKDNTFENIFSVIYDTDKEASVPLDEANKDYQAIQQWIADGGTVIDNPPE